MPIWVYFILGALSFVAGVWLGMLIKSIYLVFSALNTLEMDMVYIAKNLDDRPMLQAYMRERFWYCMQIRFWRISRDETLNEKSRHEAQRLAKIGANQVVEIKYNERNLRKNKSLLAVGWNGRKKFRSSHIMISDTYWLEISKIISLYQIFDEIATDYSILWPTKFR